MTWIKMSDPQGHPLSLSLSLCTEQMVRIRPPIAGADFLPSPPDTRMPRDHKDADLTSARSIIDLASGMQAVRETADEIIKCIKNAGKDEDAAAGP